MIRRLMLLSIAGVLVMSAGCGGDSDDGDDGAGNGAETPVATSATDGDPTQAATEPSDGPTIEPATEPTSDDGERLGGTAALFDAIATTALPESGGPAELGGMAFEIQDEPVRGEVSYMSWEAALPTDEGVFFYIYVFQDETASTEAYEAQRYAEINPGVDKASATPTMIGGVEGTCMDGNNASGTNSFAICAVPFGATQVYALANFQALDPERTEQDIAADTAAYALTHIQAAQDSLP